MPSSFSLPHPSSVFPRAQMSELVTFALFHRHLSPPHPPSCVTSEKPYAVISQLKAFTKYEFGVRIITDQEKHGAFTMLEAQTTEDSQYLFVWVASICLGSQYLFVWVVSICLFG